MNLTKSKSARVFAGVVGAVMALSFAIPAGAATTAELTAMINSLLAQIASLQAQMGGATGGTTFTMNLTVGSTGAEVSSLQQWLVSKGYLTMPAGVAFGTFGPLTRTALAKYQAEAGISPAAGYFGPITRAKLNAMAGGGTTPGTPGTSPTPATGITTPGVEGTISVTQNNSGIVSTVYEGDDMVAIFGFDVEAKTSDMAVQRIKLDLDEDDGSDTKFFNKIFKKLYVTEGGNTLASMDLNSSTVVKDGSDYFITLTGFNLIVPKNAKKQVVIKADLYDAIDSTDFDAENYTIAFPSAGSGVRAVDGAGIDQYAGASTVTRTPVVSADLSESATLTLSLNSASPVKREIIAAQGASENEQDDVTLLVFDAKAEKDDVTITDLDIGVWKTGSGGATASTSISLFDGSAEIDSATLSGGDNSATFSDIDVVVPKGTTKTFTVKADIRSANGTVANFVASATAAMVTDENRKGDAVTDSGSATGYQVGIRNAGPEITLVSKSITSNGVPQSATSNSFSTSSLSATFTVKIKAVGSSIDLGTVASSAPVFASTTVTTFKVYRNGAYDNSIGGDATSTSFSLPSSCTTGSLSNGCTLAEGAEITFPVSFAIKGRKAGAGGGDANPSGLYAVGIEAVQWTNSSGAAQTTTFMAGETDWRTAEVAFP